MTFSIDAVPIGPVCKTLRPSVVSRGNIRSNVGRSQPAKMEILPVSARWQPPDTGHSMAEPPLASTSAARRLTSSTSVVDISAQILPSLMPASTPSCASMTWAQALGDGRQVITRSHVSIISFGLSAHVAPFAIKGSARDLSRSRTVVSNPFRTNDPASLAPTLPSPMKPTFMLFFLMSCEVVVAN